MSSYLEEEDSDEDGGNQPAVDPEGMRIASEQAESLKSLGNDSFGQQDYESALKYYTEAINLLKKSSCPKNSVILLNRSATYLALKRYVPANFDAAQAAEIEPTNWKAHWRQGVALCAMTKKAFRCKQAIEAFEKCLNCGTLPKNKVAETEAALAKARHLLEQIEANTPLPDMSNCLPS